MIQRNRIGPASFLVLIILSGFGFSGFMDFYRQQVDSSAALIQAYSSLLRAEQQYDRYNRPLIPNVSLGLSRSKPLRITEEGIQSFDFAVDLSFLEFYGFTMGIQLPFSVDVEDHWKISEGTVGVTIANRNLFNDYPADEKEALAGYFDAIFSLTQARFQVFQETVRQVFQKEYFERMLGIARQRLVLFQQQRDAEPDEAKRLEYERRVLNQQKTVLSYEQQMAALPWMDNPCLFAKEAEELVQKMIEDMPFVALLDGRLDIVAQTLRVEAEQFRQSTWYYPLIPNLGVTLQIKPFDSFAWSLQVEASVDLYNPDRNLEAYNRSTSIQALRLKEQQIRLQNGYAKEQSEVQRALIDMQIMNYDLPIKHKDYEKSKELWSQGLISRWEWETAQLDFQSFQLEFDQARRTLLLEQLDLLPYHGNDSDIEILIFLVHQGDRR